MPNREFGVRCCEDVNGTLWVGRPKDKQAFDLYFGDLDCDKIKKILHNVRGNRGGVFWVNKTDGVLYITKGDRPNNNYIKIEY